MNRAAVNTQARHAFSVLVRRLASGRLSSFEFENRGDALLHAHGDDSAVKAIVHAAWFVCDDYNENWLQRRRCERIDEVRREMARWVLFLRTSLPAPQSARWSQYPLPTALATLMGICWWTGIVLLFAGPAMWNWITFAASAACCAGIWILHLGRCLYYKVRPGRRAELEEAERNSIWPFETEEQMRIAATRCGYLGACEPALTSNQAGPYGIKDI